ncbi:MAG TPA: G1 family glutamic endopeptidase [Mycobacteriales bacterium]|nr:G1 family glutamic endopeptidase [Mycobacteriales bacterium]
MHRRLLGSSVIAAALCVAASVAVPVSAASPTSGQLLKTTTTEVLPLHGGTATSLNWAGYAVTPAKGGITGVNSTFTVPTAGLLPPGFAATWTGIGGYNTSDLIQAGVSENSLPDNPVSGAQYGAWYEILPAAETPITGCNGDAACTVTPGDDVSVSISLAGANLWAISIADTTAGWTWAQNVPYTSSESSAEWIHEAPTLVAQTLLANTGTTHFGPTSTYTVGSTTNTIAQGDPTLINLSPGLVNEATTSPLAADGQSFNVCAYAQTCAAP